MPARKVGLPDELPNDLAAGLAAIRARLEVPDSFPADVLAAADRAAAEEEVLRCEECSRILVRTVQSGL